MSTDKVDAWKAWLAETLRLYDAMPTFGYNRVKEERFLAHLRTQPEGYVLVPVEPTRAMLNAAWEECSEGGTETYAQP